MFLPAKGIDSTKWAVVACDQYTSQRSYWDAVEKFVNGAPSTLRLMLPEVYLGCEGEADRIAAIHSAMREYLRTGVLAPTQPGAIVVRRTVGDKTRTGLVLALDLDCYDYSAGSCSPVRATEGTIVERIPPRMRIRRGAPLEMPHILVLIDDPRRTVIEPLADQVGFETVYDVELMQRGGRLRGSFVPEAALDGVRGALSELFDESAGKYKQDDLLLFAMGDGNHSLATAKACWEELKKTLTAEQAATHPARFALCEIENVHDEGIAFEPIHRLLFGCGENDLSEITSIMARQNGEAHEIGFAEIETFRMRGAHVLPYVAQGRSGALCVPKPVQQLEVGTLQNAFDAYLNANPTVRVDYVHGEDVVREMGGKQGNIGFFLPPMKKEELFKTVVLDGALPRKTFSMGEAHEKRYYMELRQITPGV